ncbi:hypothetical protein MEX01_15800 [Methylorubrum extorquens]|nr:hypothetical protein MEX01_15800 [Methylorubrum extorquens]
MPVMPVIGREIRTKPNAIANRATSTATAIVTLATIEAVSTLPTAVDASRVEPSRLRVIARAIRSLDWLYKESRPGPTSSAMASRCSPRSIIAMIRRLASS